MDASANVAATAAYISACAAAKADGLKIHEQALGRMQKGAEAVVRASGIASAGRAARAGPSDGHARPIRLATLRLRRSQE